MLARLGEQLEIPLIVTSTQETMESLGTNLPAIQKAAPKAYATRIRRGGTLNAFDDPKFVDAVTRTGSTEPGDRRTSDGCLSESLGDLSTPGELPGASGGRCQRHE